MPNMMPRVYFISLTYELTIHAVSRIVVNGVVDVSIIKVIDRADLIYAHFWATSPVLLRLGADLASRPLSCLGDSQSASSQ